MDLIHVNEVVRPRSETAIPRWEGGDAYVSGGTWLFSEPQPTTVRLIDLSQIPWPAVTVHEEAVEIAANCTYGTIERLDWSPFPAARLFPIAIRSLSSSFKTYSLATIGGNICLAFAKGMMAPVFTALDARYELVVPGGTTRFVEAGAFQTGVCLTVRAPGEYLRSVRVRRDALQRRAALRRMSFTPTSHVTAMAIATADPQSGAVALTLSGALAFPVKISIPDSAAIADAVSTVCLRCPMINDAHGAPDYRQALLVELAGQAIAEVTA